MAQVLRVGALGASVILWLALALVILPALEGGGGHSSIVQTLLGAAYVVWLLWAVAAMAYDRRLRRARVSPG
jgi:hypothetical protein